MKKEKFILVSLKEHESKKLAQIISNDTARKILDYLSEKEATESELAEKLGIPISTVHYNLQALVKGKLVEADEFHYSEKGKEVIHYKLANKFIIIAPKTTFGLKEKLKSILPVAIIVSAAAFILHFASKYFVPVKSQPTIIAEKALDRAATSKAPLIEEFAYETINKTTVLVQKSVWSDIVIWFIIGALFSLLVYLFIDYIRNKHNKFL